MPNHRSMLLSPTWPTPPQIRAYSTTRLGGGSHPPFNSLNLGLSTEDDPAVVAENRRLLQERLMLPSAPYWLIQTHSNIAIEATHTYQQQEADAAYTIEPGVICAVVTADCLPLLVTHRQGGAVAAIHAGWRSLLNGVIEETLTALAAKRGAISDYLIWLGPAISQAAFEVGPEVYDAFIEKAPADQIAFHPSDRPQHFYADLYQLARNRLTRMGVPEQQIYGGDYCTYRDEALFFSYRRDGAASGRMASLIWIAPEGEINPEVEMEMG